MASTSEQRALATPVGLDIVSVGARGLKKTIQDLLPDILPDRILGIHSAKSLETLSSDVLWDVILFDAGNPLCSPSTIQLMRTRQPRAFLVAIATSPSLTQSVELMKRRLDEYLDVGSGFEALRALLVERTEVKRRVTQQSQERQTAYGMDAFIGQSPPTRQVKSLMQRLRKNRSMTVLLRGETGTGKELIARILHHQSTRSGTPFVEINCAAIPEQLLEAELFGYEPGAFTDAKTRKLGLFELAESGTLFLDEIGHMSVGLQVKLIKALEEREFRRLGGTRLIQLKARLLAATNRDLEQAMEHGEFRPDLYYRLSVMTIAIPPLRERGEDVCLLAQHFADIFYRDAGQQPQPLSPGVKDILLKYPWPGNVRELRNAIERAVLLSDNVELHPDDLFPDRREVRMPDVLADHSAASQDGDSDVAALSLAEVERRHILVVLESTSWNRSRSARILGISRPRLMRKITEYALTPG